MGIPAAVVFHRYNRRIPKIDPDNDLGNLDRLAGDSPDGQPPAGGDPGARQADKRIFVLLFGNPVCHRRNFAFAKKHYFNRLGRYRFGRAWPDNLLVCQRRAAYLGKKFRIIQA